MRLPILIYYFVFWQNHLNYNSLFAHKYNKSYKFFHAIHILPNLAHWWYRANLSFECLSFIPLLFLLHTIFFVHIGIHTHTHVFMLTYTLYSRSKRQTEHFVDLTFLICNYFPRIDFQKWYCYDKYVLFMFFYCSSFTMLVSKQCYTNYLPLKKI